MCVCVYVSVCVFVCVCVFMLWFGLTSILVCGFAPLKLWTYFISQPVSGSWGIGNDLKG